MNAGPFELAAFVGGWPAVTAGSLAACRLGGLLLAMPLVHGRLVSLRLKMGILTSLTLCIAMSEPVRTILLPSDDVLGELSHRGGWVRELHEQSISLIPKLFAAGAVAFVLMPWFLSALTEYTRDVLSQLSTVGGFP